MIEITFKAKNMKELALQIESFLGTPVAALPPAAEVPDLTPKEPKKRGRPPKIEQSELKESPAEPKKRGRPAKNLLSPAERSPTSQERAHKNEAEKLTEASYTEQDEKDEILEETQAQTESVATISTVRSAWLDYYDKFKTKGEEYIHANWGALLKKTSNGNAALTMPEFGKAGTPEDFEFVANCLLRACAANDLAFMNYVDTSA